MKLLLMRNYPKKSKRKKKFLRGKEKDMKRIS